jgi:hypothetical protein
MVNPGGHEVVVIMVVGEVTAALDAVRGLVQQLVAVREGLII